MPRLIRHVCAFVALRLEASVEMSQYVALSYTTLHACKVSYARSLHVTETLKLGFDTRLRATYVSTWWQLVKATRFCAHWSGNRFAKRLRSCTARRLATSTPSTRRALAPPGTYRNRTHPALSSCPPTPTQETSYARRRARHAPGPPARDP